MSDFQSIRTGVGRMVQGDPFEAQTTDKEGRPLTYKDGRPRVQYFFGLALPKNDPTWPAILALMKSVAQAGFPGGQPALPEFAWKYTDGDLPAFKEREGFPGHWVMRCATGIAPRVYKLIEGTQDFTQLLDSTELKRGYYIKAFLNIKSNESLSKPGIHLNPVGVQVIREGDIIQSGPDGTAMFGGEGGVTPLVSTITPPPTTITPPVVHTMTAKAGGQTYEQLIGAGWDDKLLISEGYMINTALGITPNGDLLA